MLSLLEGADLLRCMLPDRRMSWYPLNEPLDLWYDCPHNSATLPDAMHHMSIVQAVSDVFWLHDSIAGHKVQRILLNTGADRSFLPMQLCKSWACALHASLPAVHQATRRIFSKARGCLDVRLKLGGSYFEAQCIVCDLDMDLVLGQSWLKLHHAVSYWCPHCRRSRL